MSGTIHVCDIMSKPARTIPESSPIRDAIKGMAKHGIGCLIAMEDTELVGIITQGDILRRGLAEDLDIREINVGQLMSKPLITIGDDATIETAAGLMAINTIKRLPVVKEGKLVGIITATDIIRKEPIMARLLNELTRAKRPSTRSKSTV